MLGYRQLACGLAVAAMAISPTLAAAQPTDLEGARAGQAEGSLQARGYTLDHTAGGTQYWWNGGSRECISLYVSDGRYRDVRRAGAGDCNYSGGSKKKDNSGAIVAGALAIGILAAAAASSKKKHDDDRYDRPGRYPPPYSPARHVDCYPEQRACYERGKGYSAYWTNREFRYRY